MGKVIRVEGLSKAYDLGVVGTGTMARDFERFVARVRGKEDPFLRIGEVNDTAVKSQSNVVWSLKDINFDIEHGEAVGIIGRNGAGKSTLLKILSRITSPTTGNVKIRGRMASLLEVGTGFHPELTGKENIYLNGAILGMRKKEIKGKFDEIVDFSGIGRYIDTPVKRYSSGMYVRLAFAVAAHLEAEILIVDEVLAVGDADFQKKCLGKMNEVSKAEGRTILFVSHNMGAVSQLCKNVILLENGEVQYRGNVNDGYNLYQKNIQNDFRYVYVVPNAAYSELPAAITRIQLANPNPESLANNETLCFKITIKTNQQLTGHRIGLKINSLDNKPVGLLFSENLIFAEAGDELEVMLELENHNLAKGTYLVDVSLGRGNEETAIQELHIVSDALVFEITRKRQDLDVKIANWNNINWGSNNYNSVRLKVIHRTGDKS